MFKLLLLSLLVFRIYCSFLTESIRNSNYFKGFVVFGSACAIVCLVWLIAARIKGKSGRSAVKQYVSKRSLAEYERETKVCTRRALKELLENEKFIEMVKERGLNKNSWNWQTREEATAEECDEPMQSLNEREGQNIECNCLTLIFPQLFTSLHAIITVSYTHLTLPTNREV
eukprot:TRINITY_DN13713_c0_g1_i1.p1 TRINITY_DN13713_c0_g1~~TRINITY_DN13713_c0_g1_i1.p1  ORF type:complete len:172 (-),score=24.18 TRINITY_DN13713_c0_g1_i1:37-552(-)